MSHQSNFRPKAWNSDFNFLTTLLFIFENVSRGVGSLVALKTVAWPFELIAHALYRSYCPHVCWSRTLSYLAGLEHLPPEIEPPLYFTLFRMCSAKCAQQRVLRLSKVRLTNCAQKSTLSKRAEQSVLSSQQSVLIELCSAKCAQQRALAGFRSIYLRRRLHTTYMTISFFEANFVPEPRGAHILAFI